MHHSSDTIRAKPPPAPQVANTILFLWVGIALGFAFLPPAHPLLKTEIVIAHHISGVDAAYCVVLYLWMVVSQGLRWFVG
jgi:hypothetical protein